MGFFSEFSKALNGEDAGDRYLVAGDRVRCPHCGGERFFERDMLLDGRGSSLLGIEWAGKGATALVCTVCGHVELFAEAGLIEKC